MVGRCRTATSSVLPAGVSFFFACAVAFAAFASLGVAAAESSSLPLEAALVSGAGAPLRGAALPREAGRAVAFSGASVPSMPVSSEWSEECSAAAADAAARRVGLTCSISRSCAIARSVGKGGGESSASRASRARRLRRSQSESRGESAGTKTGGFMLTDAARTLLAGARRSRRPAAEAMPAGRLARAEAVLSSMSAILLSRRVRTREAEVTLVRQKDGFRESARNSRNETRDFKFSEGLCVFPWVCDSQPRPTAVLAAKQSPPQ